MNDRADQRLRRGLGIAMYALAVAYALSWLLLPDSGALYVFFSLTFSFTATSWCIVDSHVLDRRILRSFYWLVFFFWPIAVPIYLVWSRRWRGLGLGLLHAVGLVGAAISTYAVGVYAVAACTTGGREAPPSEAIASLNRGAFAYQLGDFSAAVAQFTAALRLDPEMATAYCGRGAARIRLRHYDEALADFEEALRLDPRLAEAYVGRAAGYYRQGRFDATIADCTRAIELKSDMPDAYLVRARASYQTARHAQAVADYTEALRLAPEYAEAYHARGKAHAAAGEDAAAQADFAEARKRGFRETQSP